MGRILKGKMASKGGGGTRGGGWGGCYKYLHGETSTAVRLFTAIILHIVSLLDNIQLLEMKTLSSNVALTSNLCVVGHTHTAHVIIGCGRNLSGTSGSVSGKKPRDVEDLKEGAGGIYDIKRGHHNNSAKYRQHQSRNVESSLNQALLLNNTVAEALLKIHRSQKRRLLWFCSCGRLNNNKRHKDRSFFRTKGTDLKQLRLNFIYMSPSHNKGYLVKINT